MNIFFDRVMYACSILDYKINLTGQKMEVIFINPTCTPSLHPYQHMPGCLTKIQGSL